MKIAKRTFKANFEETRELWIDLLNWWAKQRDVDMADAAFVMADLAGHLCGKVAKGKKELDVGFGMLVKIMEQSAGLSRQQDKRH